jgi:hypothetical protein
VSDDYVESEWCPDCSMWHEPGAHWRGFFSRNADANVMTHGWPECGPGSINVEEMYQAFKARLAAESSAGESLK